MKRNAAWMVGAWSLALAAACNDGSGGTGTSGCGGGPACDAGWICVDGRCAQLCNSTANCPPTERCEDGVCLEDHPACRTDADCVTPAPCELRSAAAFCRGGVCHYEAVDCAEQAPAKPCAAPTGACDPAHANSTCTGTGCCVYAPVWPEGSSSLPPDCPVGSEDANANGVEDGSEAWSGTCGHDGGCLKSNGSSCQTADVCLSGFCADQVCCDRACEGACDHCNLDGLAGTCTGCSDGYDCTGAGVCQAQAGAACGAGPDCASGICAESGVCCGDSGVACWVSLGVGNGHGCVVSSDGRAWCWGADASGQLGNDEALERHSVPVAVALTANVLAVSAGSVSSCARLADGTAMCWGSDAAGQLGDSTEHVNKGTPVQVQGLTSAASVATSGDHACAVLSGGTTWCWGSDAYGQLGDDAALDPKPTPTQVAVLGDHGASIAAGYCHSCAVLDDHSAWCWGRDIAGQLGDDATFADKSTPVRVADLDAVAAITTGNAHTCALLLDGTATCWGFDDNGQLGDDETLASQGTPVPVASLTNIVAISAGAVHTCALIAGGSVWCWGDDYHGQLGDDDAYVDKGTPVPVAGLGAPAVAVAAGGAHSCAALADGSIWCWGSASSGALGNGEGAGEHPLPVPVGFGLVDFAGTCGDAAECASGLCIDPFATGAPTCWYDGAECAAALGDPGLDPDPTSGGNWHGQGKYESDQLFVRARYSPMNPGDWCDSNWQPGTAVGCTSSDAFFASVDLVIDSTGCSLLDASSREVLATGGWR